jgi:hypothetical protein
MPTTKAEHSSAADEAAVRARRARHETWIALGVAGALALTWSLALSRAQSWGWDESMHAELPAARMLVAAQAGELRASIDALLGCSQYPFVYPVCLALAQAVFGLSEHVARVAGVVTWCATLFGLFLLGREVARRVRRERVSAHDAGAKSLELVPWLAMALGALSPLALAYAGTLFLEVPFTCAAVFTLRAWLRRVDEVDARVLSRRDLAAGAWLATAFFVKFNYGVLLAGGLALDWTIEAVRAARAGSLREHVRRARWLAVVPVIAGLWWFVLPVPGGLAIAHEHRTAFLEFLSGNRGMSPRPLSWRLVWAAGQFALDPRMFLLLALGLALSLRCMSNRAVLLLWLVFACAWLPVWAHPFCLDRFLIPGGAALWPLAALGVASVLPGAWPRRAAILAIIAACVVPFAAIDTWWLFERAWPASADPQLRAYQVQLCDDWHDLSGGRALMTNGLPRAEADAVLDAIAREIKSDERVAWFGVSTKFSPAALHIGLLQRGGSRQRFLRDAVAPLDVAYFATDPGWTDEQLGAFARAFDVVLFTEPITFTLQKDREYMSEYCRRLTQTLHYSKKEIADMAIGIPLGPPRRVELFACRRP